VVFGRSALTKIWPFYLFPSLAASAVLKLAQDEGFSTQVLSGRFQNARLRYV